MIPGILSSFDRIAKKSIHDSPVLQELLEAAKRCYLEIISKIEDPTMGIKNFQKISEPNSDGQRTFRGFNLFHGEDLKLFEEIVHGEFNITGFQGRSFRIIMPEKFGYQVSRMLKRPVMH
jgi:hypothetical protein